MYVLGQFESRTPEMQHPEWHPAALKCSPVWSMPMLTGCYRHGTCSSASPVLMGNGSEMKCRNCCACGHLQICVDYDDRDMLKNRDIFLPQKNMGVNR